MIDTFLPFFDIEYLEEVNKKHMDNLNQSESISFIVGGNSFKEGKAKLEIEFLWKLIDVLKTRKRHQAQFKDLVDQTERESQVIESIKSILG